MVTEIGARNFGDTYRYNMLPVRIPSLVNKSALGVAVIT